MGAESNKAMKSLNTEINTYLDTVFKDLKNELTKRTPIRSGNARRGWRQTGRYDINNTGVQEVLRNDVPYVGLLEEGRSKQAPQGMIGPAVDAVNRRNNKK